jgi:hypothetical protein
MLTETSRFRGDAFPEFTQIIGILAVVALRENARGKSGMLEGTQTTVDVSGAKGIPMPEEGVPRWHPIAALPMIGEAIDGMLESAQDVVQSLEQARPRPHVLDDYTIGRVREAHGTQLKDLWWYTEQLARWQHASPTPAQAQELTRLGGQLEALRRTLTASLALAEELQAGTIDKVLAKDDVELALEFLQGKRRP